MTHTRDKPENGGQENKGQLDPQRWMEMAWAQPKERTQEHSPLGERGASGSSPAVRLAAAGSIRREGGYKG